MVQKNRLLSWWDVALFTRAWIEIPTPHGEVFRRLVALFTRAWIEIPIPSLCRRLNASPSLRGRGLKYTTTYARWEQNKSPSLRGRGLKCHIICNLTRCAIVALFTRAWIEMLQTSSLPVSLTSPSLRGRGLKLCVLCKVHIFSLCRPLYEGVD